jgi:molecular chaperone GrpE
MRHPLSVDGLDPTAEAELDPAGDDSQRDRAVLSRALRDLEDAKARVERDAHAVLEETRASLVSEILPVLDNLDRSIHAALGAGNAPSIVEGVQLVRAQLEGVLRRYGLERFDARGHRFDPAVHEAISLVAVADPQHDRRVLEQVLPGYRFGDRLLRAAQVVVGRYAPRYH